MSTDQRFSPMRDANRSDRIHQVVRECLCRDMNGERIPVADVLKDHPDLLPELADELKKLEHLAAAWEAVDRQDSAPSERVLPNVAAESSGLELRVRCPHCHAAISIVAASTLDSITCNSCGHDFSLVGESDDDVQLKCPGQVGRFEIVESLGVGGFGTVWKAWDGELDRFVAVKIPRRRRLTSTETEHFFREARAAAQLRHPNIVSIHEVGRDGDHVYIVSDLVEGVSLAEWSADQRMTAREAAVLCQRIAAALAHAH